MPGTPTPIVGPMGPVWTPVVQALQNHKQAAKGLAAAQQQGATYDRWMNTVTLSGSNLDQTVTIGAVWQCAGVQVQTNLGSPSAPVAGIAKQTNLVTGTVAYVGPNNTPTLTAGVTCAASSNSATLDSSLAAAWAGCAGYVIGAADLDDFTDAIVPGTVIASIATTGGITTLHLTPPPRTPPMYAVVATGVFYCAACEFVVL
jgi:hypothetical protein